MNRPETKLLLQAAVIILITVLAYLPSLHGDFLWDDDDHISQNETLRNLDGLVRIWCEPGATMQYYPLTFTVWWLEYYSGDC